MMPPLAEISTTWRLVLYRPSLLDRNLIAARIIRISVGLPLGEPALAPLDQRVHHRQGGDNDNDVGFASNKKSQLAVPP